MNPDYEDNGEERDILGTCALRFDGYKYVENRKFDHVAAFRTIEQTGDLAPFEQYQHLALFFMSQRYLYKWGGDMLSRRSPEWRTFRELFFLCCRANIPKAYRFEPYYTEWERTYAPRIDECIALVRRTHESINYLPKGMAHPSLYKDSNIDIAIRQKLGLIRDELRRFEERAVEVMQLFSDTEVERTRDAIQISTGGERGIVLLLTPEALEVRLPTIDWTKGAYGPAASSKLSKRVLWENVSSYELQKLCRQAMDARDGEFVRCRFCGEEFPPERRHGDVCHGCAERNLGVVH